MPKKDVFGSVMDSIRERTAKIGIIGLGYVGLPIKRRFCEEGFKVLGFDIDPAKVEDLNNGKSYIRQLPAERLATLVKGKDPLFTATSDMDRLPEPDVLIICVPTPLSDKREPDLSSVENTSKEIARRLRPGQLVSLESTTYPGTTGDILMPLFTAGGMKAGTDFFLVFSPEREDPGRVDFNTQTTPKIVGGVTKKCLKAGCELYSKIVDKVVPVSSTSVAEMSKLLENIYRCGNR